MNKIFVSLSSISMDLERVAMGYQRGSVAMANRFLKEALMRRNEIDRMEIRPHVRKLIGFLGEIKNEKDNQKKAEDALMCSTLFQNAALASKS